MELLEAPVSAPLPASREAALPRSSNTAALLGFTILYFAGSLAWASQRMLWFDELFTYKIAQLRTYGEIWTAIRVGIESNPPLSFVLAHWSQHAFGVNAVATRLPAIVGFWLMSICLFAFVRYRTCALHGFLAMLVPSFTIAAFYAIEARPYGMVLGATAAALLCWQRAADAPYRGLAIAGLALSVAALGSLHYHAVYVPLAIGAGEAVRCYKNRRVDVPVPAALLVGLGSVLLWLPLIAAARGFSSHFWASPSFEVLGSSLRDLASPLWFIVLTVGLLLRDRNRSLDATPPPYLPLYEIVAGSLLLAMPAIMFLAALLATNAHHIHYVLPAVPGFAILVAFWMYRIRDLAPRLSRFTVAMFGACFAATELLNLLTPVTLSAFPAMVKATFDFPSEPALPIAIADDDSFLRVRQYLDAPLANRCYYLVDSKAASQFYGIDTGERSLSEWRRFQSNNIVDYQVFVREHPDFYAIRINQHTWLLQNC